MHKKLTIEIGASKSWSIIIGDGILGKLGEFIDFKLYSAIVLMTDTATGKLYGQQVKEALEATRKRVLIFTVPMAENSKSLEEAERVYRFLMNNNVGRKALLCVLGGGVVGDLGGYIAATYLRGIDYIQLPTTLLAQVDSSIGGKVGVNFGKKKNIIGSFYQPRAIVSDVTLLQSLPAEEMRNGTAEVIKYGLAMDKELFQRLSDRGKGEFAPSELVGIVERCSILKTEIVKVDEMERSGQRAILNFGHTVGHAVEASVGSWGQHHGEAVAIGMVAAAKISEQMGMLNSKSVDEIDNILTRFGLPARCRGMTPDKLLGAMTFDKKATDGQVKWVLLEEIGHGVVNCTVGEDIVREVLREMCQ